VPTNFSRDKHPTPFSLAEDKYQAHLHAQGKRRERSDEIGS
jgi:hypothetical protein